MRCLNVGDQAMLETSYSRCRGIWPSAEIRVLTLAPDQLRRTLPGAIPLCPEGRDECFDPKIFGRLSTSGYPLSRIFRGLEELTFKHAPGMQAQVAQTKMKVRDRPAAALMIATLGSTDLFVFSGAAMITDAFAREAKESLETLYLAKRFGARA